MPAASYSDPMSATKASDFLNFDVPSYNKDPYKSQFDTLNGQKSPPLGQSNGSTGRFFGDKSSTSTFASRSEDNFLLKGIEFVTNGASNIRRGVMDTESQNESQPGLFISRMSSMISIGKAAFGLSSDWQTESSWRTYTNYKAFLVLFATSLIFFIMAFMTLPFIIFAPHKFGLLFTCASITFLISIALLKGAGSLIDHMLHSKRIVFTAAFLISLVSTLIFTTIYPLYLLAFVSSLTQFFSLMSVVLSYIPGGAGALKALYSSIWAYFRLSGRGSASDLPF
ncbi:conserved hypothetical protein [Theileria equi strain WA]|uniref:Vesicle transport protein n=1 Tax=Theileria equi strain WA TaxID=1537102 RepID=L1LDE2_THEEQ|nr:conserved hypothetical protein [Theileria equi strain WA]EKX73250.1 conserved hypothetical protein [Theileria equi strain WA]|eukprot:XP_004832702.1 conserved hypothetical protein [Theileria equi strain WA]